MMKGKESIKPSIKWWNNIAFSKEPGGDIEKKESDLDAMDYSSCIISGCFELYVPTHYLLYTLEQLNPFRVE